MQIPLWRRPSLCTYRIGRWHFFFFRWLLVGFIHLSPVLPPKVRHPGRGQLQWSAQKSLGIPAVNALVYAKWYPFLGGEANCWLESTPKTWWIGTLLKYLIIATRTITVCSWTYVNSRVSSSLYYHMILLSSQISKTPGRNLGERTTQIFASLPECQLNLVVTSHQIIRIIIRKWKY